VAEIIAFGEDARAKLQTLNSAIPAGGKSTCLEKSKPSFGRLARALSAKRRKVIPQLSRAVSKQLSELVSNKAALKYR